jgi:hypothetical protein
VLGEISQCVGVGCSGVVGLLYLVFMAYCSLCLYLCLGFLYLILIDVVIL